MGRCQDAPPPPPPAFSSVHLTCMLSSNMQRRKVWLTSPSRLEINMWLAIWRCVEVCTNSGKWCVRFYSSELNLIQFLCNSVIISTWIIYLFIFLWNIKGVFKNPAVFKKPCHLFLLLLFIFLHKCWSIFSVSYFKSVTTESLHTAPFRTVFFLLICLF